QSIVVRKLDADGRLARNAIDAHELGLERKAEIVAKARNPGILHAGLRFELEGRDNRSRMDLLHGAGNFEFAGFFFEHARPLAKFVLVYRESGGRSMEKRGRRELRGRSDRRLCLRFGSGARAEIRDYRLFLPLLFGERFGLLS